MTAGTPTLEIQGSTGWLRLNRPKQHNRFGLDDISTVTRLLRDLATVSAPRVLVITASGPSFCSGFSMEALSSVNPALETAQFAEMCDLIEEAPYLTVCGLNGSVIGGGADVAIACDVRIGVSSASLLVPPTRHGIQFYYSGLRRFVENIGLSAAQQLFLVGEPIDAHAMLRIGFLHDVVEPDALEAKLESLSRALALRSAASQGGLKKSLRSIARLTADPAEINERFERSLISMDAREGLAAWREKRAPRFT